MVINNLIIYIYDNIAYRYYVFEFIVSFRYLEMSGETADRQDGDQQPFGPPIDSESWCR